jgi:tetratricopeptide (TPR) repeat protein
VVAALIASLPVRAAEPNDAEARARKHYTAGKTLYELGNYTDAVRELLVGYALVPKPQFLLNIGQCYRKLGDLPKAREMYAKFLADAPRDVRERPQVEALVAELDKQIAAERAAAAATVPPPHLLDLPPEPPKPPLAPAVTAPPPTAKAKRRPYWAIPVALIGAAGLGVGLYFALRPTCGASYGCVSATGTGP